jgi:hypothetical protein
LKPSRDIVFRSSSHDSIVSLLRRQLLLRFELPREVPFARVERCLLRSEQRLLHDPSWFQILYPFWSGFLANGAGRMRQNKSVASLDATVN